RDWSSDVCSSDLGQADRWQHPGCSPGNQRVASPGQAGEQQTEDGPVSSGHGHQGRRSVKQGAGHYQRILAAAHRRIVATPASYFIEPGPLIEVNGSPVGFAHLQKNGFRPSFTAAPQQMLEQLATQPVGLAFRFYRQVEQMALVPRSGKYPMPYLLIAEKHQPALITGFDAVKKDAPRPGVAEGGKLDPEHRIHIGLAHRAELRLAHCSACQRRMMRCSCFQRGALRWGWAMSSPSPGANQTGASPSSTCSPSGIPCPAACSGPASS